MVSVRRRAIGAAKWLSVFYPLGMLMSAFTSVGGTVGNQRVFPSLQRRGILGTGQELMKFEFLNGTVYSVPGQPGALRLTAEEDTSRTALLESLLPQDAFSSSMNYDVTYKVQCLVRHSQYASTTDDSPIGWCTALACNLSQPLVDGDELFTNGTLVTGLTPNTDYQCFVIVSYDGHARCTSKDSIDVVATLPNPPTDVTVSNPTSHSLDVAGVAPTGPSGNAVPVQGYAFQCSLESDCDPNGPWFPSPAPFVSDPTTAVTVDDLAKDTTYNCWAATVAGDSAPYEYSCSDLAKGTTPGALEVSGSNQGEVDDMAAASSDPSSSNTYKVACFTVDGSRECHQLS